MESSESDHRAWWGTVALDPETGGKWDIGPSTLWVYRAQQDWRIIHRPSTDPVRADPMAQRSNVTVPVADNEMKAVLAAGDDDLVTSRFSVRDTDESIALRPALADRPVVSRPEHPLYVLPDETVTLYLSTPLWIRIELVETERQLQEVPSHRMSDTWFGPSPREGELCYATRTAGRLRLDQLPLRLHRALTPLRVRNTSTTPLALERVQLPAPHLALFETPNDTLWTQAVTVTHSSESEGASVHVEPGPPADAKQAKRIQPPRESDRKGLFISTFSTFGAFFGS